jgi:hypothetical protein
MSFWRTLSRIERDGTTWLMKPARYFGETFNVLSDGGTNLGAIAPVKYFFRCPTSRSICRTMCQL